jgi:hypothetical protein
MNATKILDKMNLPDDIRHHPNVVLAEEQAKLDWWVIGLLQGFYMLGVAATGYATFDLFLKAGFPFLAAIGAAVVIDAFGVVAATLSTRARLRNQTDLSTRAIVYLGAVASGVMNYLFHSEAMLKIGLPIVVVLSMVCWVKSVADKYAAIFLVQKMIAQRERQARRDDRRQKVAYVAAVGVWSTKGNEEKGVEAREGAVAAWRRRTQELGLASREARHELALTRVAAQQQIGTAEVVAEIEAATGSARPQISPRPPAGRPASAPPVQVTGEGPLADFLRETESSTDAVRRLMSEWWINYQEGHADLFGLPFSTVNSAAAMSRLLAEYGLTIHNSSVSGEKSKLIRANRFPDAEQAKRVTGIVDATVVEDAAITAG